MDSAVLSLHATLFVFLDEKKYAAKTGHWLYFHEIAGLRAHLEALDSHHLPSPALVNMQGMEALNSVVTGYCDDLTRGLTPLGLPNGQQSRVPFAPLYFQITISNTALLGNENVDC